MTRRPVAAKAVAALAAAAVLAAVAAFLGLVAGPRVLGYRTLCVLSGSMSPGMPTGSMVIVQPVPSEALRVGDVITFQPPEPHGMVITHRVVEIVEAGSEPVVRTKGDANEVADPWVARLQGGTIWRATRVVPHLGTVIMAMRLPAIRLALLHGGAALFVISALAALWRGPHERTPIRRRVTSDESTDYGPILETADGSELRGRAWGGSAVRPR